MLATPTPPFPLSPETEQLCIPYHQNLATLEKRFPLRAYPETIAQLVDTLCPEPAQSILANLTYWGWMLAEIADDVLDHDLPITSIPAIIELSLIMESLLQQLPLSEDERLIARNDLVRTWHNAVSTHLEDPANKSLGHVRIAALTLSLSHSPQYIPACERFIQNLLAAKQLSDDLRDWRSDAEAGLHTHATILRPSSTQELPLYYVQDIAPKLLSQI